MLTLINQSLNWCDFCEREVDGRKVRGGGGDRMKSGCVVLLLLQDRWVLLGSPVLKVLQPVDVMPVLELRVY